MREMIDTSLDDCLLTFGFLVVVRTSPKESPLHSLVVTQEVEGGKPLVVDWVCLAHFLLAELDVCFVAYFLMLFSR